MIKLKIEKMINYLSPSSLMTAMNNPNTFYLTRLVNDRIPKESQGKAAAIGTAFDLLVKNRIWGEGISPHTKDKQESLLNGIELKEFEDEALSIGKRILNNYIRGAYGATKFVDIEIQKLFNFHDIPIMVKLDATCKDSYTGLVIPFDWKVSGFNPDSNSAISPKPGYYIMYNGSDINTGHKSYVKDIPIEQLNISWAIQTCTYGWAIGLSPQLIDSFPVRIDMVTITKTQKIRTSCYRGLVTPSFQKYVFNLYKNTWQSLKNGSYINKLMSPYIAALVYTASTKETWF